MKRKYHKIQELIELWSEFEENHSKTSFLDFGNWLTSVKQDKQTIEDCSELDLLEESSDHVFFYKQMRAERQFLTLLSRAARFIDFYIQKAFEELPIKSRLEFQFLISVHEMNNPRKTDIINFNLVEISTGVETLKRLQKKGLIEDGSDENDRRVKRITLTTFGEKTVISALKRFDDLDKLVHTFDKENSWKSFIPVLMKFNDHHTNMYRENKEESFDTLLEKSNLKTFQK
jgi:DNA-binding MarR family transcriptional regulator